MQALRDMEREKARQRLAEADRQDLTYLKNILLKLFETGVWESLPGALARLADIQRGSSRLCKFQEECGPELSRLPGLQTACCRHGGQTHVPSLQGPTECVPSPRSLMSITTSQPVVLALLQHAPDKQGRASSISAAPVQVKLAPCSRSLPRCCSSARRKWTNASMHWLNSKGRLQPLLVRKQMLATLVAGAHGRSAALTADRADASCEYCKWCLAAQP